MGGVYLATQVGRAGQIFNAPNSAPASDGCGVIVSGSDFVFTDSPVATEDYVDDALAAIDLSPYATVSYVDSGLSAKANLSAANFTGLLRASGASLGSYDIAFQAPLFSVRNDGLVAVAQWIGGGDGSANFNAGSHGVTVGPSQCFGFSGSSFVFGAGDTQWKRVSANVSKFVGGDGTTLGTLQVQTIKADGTSGVLIVGDPVTGSSPLRVYSGATELVQVTYAGMMSLAVATGVYNVGGGYGHFKKTGTGSGIDSYNDVFLRPGALQAGTTQAVKCQYSNGAEAPLTAGTATLTTTAFYRNLGVAQLQKPGSLAPGLAMEHGDGIGAISYYAGELLIYNRSTSGDVVSGDLAFKIGTNLAATFSGLVSCGVYTVATLPSASANAGKEAQVTDSSVASSGNFGATVSGGGSNRVKVFSDGTNWIIN